MIYKRISIAYVAIFFTFLLMAQERTVGIIESIDPYPGYTLFSPHADQNVYLIDNCGEVVKKWSSIYFPGNATYLTSDGTLYRAGRTTTDSKITAGGAGGIIEKFSWNNEIEWSYTYVNDQVRHHHDFNVLPNGNVLLVAWEVIEIDEAIENGRNPDLISENVAQVWPDHIIEVEPNGISGGNIVWEWHAWDHLIQDFDPTKLNYGKVDQNPGKINVNFAIDNRADWLHVNSIDYHASLDLILLSVPFFNEIWIIDHNTTTEEAKGIAGDLKYRWGNPQAYGKGSDSDQRLFGQHTVQWIKSGQPNEGDVLIFNNGQGRLDGNYSSVDLIPFEVISDFGTNESGQFLPDRSNILYKSDPKEAFFSSFLSGAQQLPNGNLLICEGPSGTFFEVTPSGDRVWQYVNPISFAGILSQGDAITPPGFSDPANLVFRAVRYPKSYPAFVALGLNSPSGPIELNPTPFDCQIVLSVENHNDADLITIYPNPANEKISVKAAKPLNDELVTLSDSSGKIVLQKEIPKNGDVLSLDIKYLKKGTYFIRINQLTKKLIVN